MEEEVAPIEEEPQCQAGRDELQSGLIIKKTWRTFGDVFDQHRRTPVDDDHHHQHQPPCDDDKDESHNIRPVILKKDHDMDVKDTTPPVVDEEDICTRHNVKDTTILVSTKKWGFIRAKKCHGWRYIKVKKLICKPNKDLNLNKPGYRTRKPTFDKYLSEPEDNSLVIRPGEGDIVEGFSVNNYDEKMKVGLAREQIMTPDK